MASLQLRCASCKVSSTCPEQGASPLVLNGGKKTLLCSIVGGYSRDPVDLSSLSPESADRAAKDGPCLSLAEVPRVDESTGMAYFEVVKIFHQPMRHPRETSTVRFPESMLPSSHNREPTRR